MTLETVKEVELYKSLLKTTAVSYTICVYFGNHQKLYLYLVCSLECSLRIILNRKASRENK